MKKFLIAAVIIVVGLGLLLTFPPDPVFNKLLELERERHGVTHKTVTVDGETWHYLEGGEEHDKTIVLIHGFGADKDNWMRFSKHLVQDYRIIAPDLPGWGESVRHEDWDYRIPAQIKRLDAFVTHLELNRFHLAGNSMGGNITGLYGATYPGKVITLGLFNAAGVNEPNKSELTLAAERGEVLLAVDSVDDMDRIIEFASYKPPFVPPAAKRRLGERALARSESNKAIFWSLFNDPNGSLEPKLSNIQTPTLVLWGDTDRLLDVSMTQVYGSRLPNNEVVVMEQTGHLPMVEKPAESALIYRTFIGKH